MCFNSVPLVGIATTALIVITTIPQNIPNTTKAIFVGICLMSNNKIEQSHTQKIGHRKTRCSKTSTSFSANRIHF